MGQVKTVDRRKRPPFHFSKRTSKRRKNPAKGLKLGKFLDASIGDLMIRASLHGASFPEKAIVAAVMPGLMAIIRGEGNFGPKDHWKAFKPHCPSICGVPCPPTCKHYGEVRFDGCHVCDHLHGKKDT